jgi:hypothetical protein
MNHPEIACAGHQRPRAGLVEREVVGLLPEGKKAHSGPPSGDPETDHLGVEALRPRKVADLENGMPPSDRSDVLWSRCTGHGTSFLRWGLDSPNRPADAEVNGKFRGGISDI